MMLVFYFLPLVTAFLGMHVSSAPHHILCRLRHNNNTASVVAHDFVVPEIPEIPAMPVIPDVPEVPAIPDVPEVPAIPDVPEIPAIPDVPEIPAIAPTPTSTPSLPPTPTPTPPLPPSSSALSGGAGFCWEPYHDDRFPMAGKGDVQQILPIIEDDFQRMSKETKVIRTFFSVFFNKEYASIAQKYGMKLYLGIQMFDNPEWYEEQIQGAINAWQKYPDTVLAIIIGSENLAGNGGKYNGVSLLNQIEMIRGKFRAAGVTTLPPMGTSQRINEWLLPNDDINTLAASVDIIGVNIYPFFTPGFDVNKPGELLEAQWEQVQERFPEYHSKMIITESGWPTAGIAPPDFPQNIPNVRNAKAYYDFFMQWKPNVPHFWFKAFDRRSDDPMMASGIEFEKHFGRYTTDGQVKY